jgi:hypothetical protein
MGSRTPPPCFFFQPCPPCHPIPSRATPLNARFYPSPSGHNGPPPCQFPRPAPPTEAGGQGSPPCGARPFGAASPAGPPSAHPSRFVAETPLALPPALPIFFAKSSSAENLSRHTCSPPNPSPSHPRTRLCPPSSLLSRACAARAAPGAAIVLCGPPRHTSSPAAGPPLPPILFSETNNTPLVLLPAPCTCFATHTSPPHPFITHRPAPAPPPRLLPPPSLTRTPPSHFARTHPTHATPVAPAAGRHAFRASPRGALRPCARPAAAGPCPPRTHVSLSAGPLPPQGRRPESSPAEFFPTHSPLHTPAALT